MEKAKKKAKWIEIKNTPYSYITVCSNCKRPAAFELDKCPWCGSEMENGKKR